MIPFPIIPSAMLDVAGLIEPCPEVRDWARAMFLDSESEFYNADHEHLADASTQFLWTNVEYDELGQRVLGTAQLAKAGGKAWPKAQREEQLHRWFRHEPDFLIILNAAWLSSARPEQICAVVEHELYHCFYQVDEFGEPKLTRDGQYRWAMRGHDVEQFTGVMERYGPIFESEERFIQAAKSGPLFKGAQLDGICGSCVR